jgi:hypothetical protein
LRHGRKEVCAQRCFEPGADLRVEKVLPDFVAVEIANRDDAWLDGANCANQSHDGSQFGFAIDQGCKEQELTSGVKCFPNCDHAIIRGSPTARGKVEQ